MLQLPKDALSLESYSLMLIALQKVTSKIEIEYCSTDGETGNYSCTLASMLDSQSISETEAIDWAKSVPSSSSPSKTT